jgi:hypothetical protein
MIGRAIDAARRAGGASRAGSFESRASRWPLQAGRRRAADDPPGVPHTPAPTRAGRGSRSTVATILCYAYVAVGHPPDWHAEPFTVDVRDVLVVGAVSRRAITR